MTDARGVGRSAHVWGRGKVETTPLMLVADEQGEFVTYMRGYQKEEILVPALQEFVPGYCSEQ